MNMFELSPLAQVPAQEGPPLLIQFFPFLIILVMFYFLLIRPQQKKMKEHRAMVDALKSGDKVIVGGGIHGVVTNLKEGVITVRIADSVKIDVERSSVTTVVAGTGDAS